LPAAALQREEFPAGDGVQQSRCASSEGGEYEAAVWAEDGRPADTGGVEGPQLLLSAGGVKQIHLTMIGGGAVQEEPAVVTKPNKYAVTVCPE
jgi:hypothetical protein